MVDHCHINVEEEEKFFLFPIKSIQASCTSDKTKYNVQNVLDTSYDNCWNCLKKGSYITLEPDYTAKYLKGKGINQVHISFGYGQSRVYYFQIQASDQREDKYVNLTGQLMSSGRSDALEPYYLAEEIKPKFVRIVFNGNNVDETNTVFTIQLVNAEMQSFGNSYIPNLS